MKGIQQGKEQGFNGIFREPSIISYQIMDTLLKGKYNYYVITKWTEFELPFPLFALVQFLVIPLPLP